MVLVVPSATVPKGTVVADSVVGAIPVPVSATFCEPLVGVVVMVRVPVSEATEAGVRVTPMLQLAPAASELPHVVVGDETLAKPVPETPIDLIVMAADPVFVKVTFPTALVSWTTTLPKANVPGETVVAATAKEEEKRQNITVSESVIAF